MGADRGSKAQQICVEDGEEQDLGDTLKVHLLTPVLYLYYYCEVGDDLLDQCLLSISLNVHILLFDSCI